MRYLQITETNDIYNALLSFSECFPHLKEKVTSLYVFAEKLAYKAEVYIGLSEDKPIGITCFYANDYQTRCGYITLIGVKSNCRKKGIGKDLLCFSIEKMQEKGMQTVKLEVDKDNYTAIGFYQHMGFQTLSEIENGFYLIKEIVE